MTIMISTTLLTLAICLLLLLSTNIIAFNIHSRQLLSTRRISSAATQIDLAHQPLARRQLSMMAKETIVNVPLGEGYKDVPCKFRPLFANSEFFVVTYKVPFGLNVEKPPKGFPAPIVTKDGSGGEKVGDVLRATTCWSQGFNAAGATSDIMMFAGNVKWRKSIFDATGAPWQQTIDALVSNTKERSDEVTLVFERELAADVTVATEPPASAT